MPETNRPEHVPTISPFPIEPHQRGTFQYQATQLLTTIAQRVTDQRLTPQAVPVAIRDGMVYRSAIDPMPERADPFSRYTAFQALAAVARDHARRTGWYSQGWVAVFATPGDWIAGLLGRVDPAGVVRALDQATKVVAGGKHHQPH